MNNPKDHITVIIRPGHQQGYVAECVEISVITQGNTLDEVVRNLKEAVSLHLEDENLHEFGLIAKPALHISLELQLEYA